MDDWNVLDDGTSDDDVGNVQTKILLNIQKQLSELNNRMNRLEQDMVGIKDNLDIVVQHVMEEDTADARKRNIMIRRGKAFHFKPDTASTGLSSILPLFPTTMGLARMRASTSKDSEE